MRTSRSMKSGAVKNFFHYLCAQNVQDARQEAFNDKLE